MTVDRTDLKNVIHTNLVAQLVGLGAAPDQDTAYQRMAQAIADALMDYFLAKMAVSVSVTVGTQTGVGTGTVS